MNKLILRTFTLIITATLLLLFPIRTAKADDINCSITVNLGNIINSDFLGVGVNVLPMQMMENNVSKGYRDACWDVEKKRIVMMQPRFARVLFQLDWMEPSQGVYTWDSLKMQAFYKCLDALQEAGTEVELNFGWKVGREIHSWFAIPNPSVDPCCSAPNNLNAYAASCSQLINQLVNQKGYTNVKYLSFYNEPQGDYDYDYPDGGDKKAYYAQMVQAVHNKLVADGRRSLVKIWGPEEFGDPSWITYMKDNANNCFDGYTFHAYQGYYSLSDTIVPIRDYVSPKPSYMTEFGFSGDGGGWDGGYANSVIKCANERVSGLAAWKLNGAWLEDPYEDMELNTYNTGYDLWDYPNIDINPSKIYYQMSLLTRYIPSHSQVIFSSSSDSNVRVAAFKTNDDYTILVECNEGQAKNLTFNFSGAINKTFGKHVYKGSVTSEGNALIPQRVSTFTAGTSFSDNTVDSDYCVLVYTTLPEQKQVAVTPVNPMVEGGGSIQLNASILGGSDSIIWSVIGNENGTINSTGLYTAPKGRLNDTLVAVKAQCANSPSCYGIALIQVGLENLALNKNVTVSSSFENYGWSVSNVVDGKRLIYPNAAGWSSAGANTSEWVRIDLGANYPVNQVDLHPKRELNHGGEFFPKDFTIKVSTDNTNWVTVASKENYPYPGNTTQTFYFKDISARYVKIDMVDIPVTEHVQFCEIEVYKDTKSNLALNKPVTVSSSFDQWGWNSMYANDGIREFYSTQAGWSSTNSSSTQWYKVDLQQVSKVNRVDIYPKNQPGYVGEFFPKNFNINLSTDNVNWTTVVTQTNYPRPDGSVQSFSFSEADARYVKIDITNIPIGEYIQLDEMEVYRDNPLNLALGKTVSSSSSLENWGWYRQYVVDGRRDYTDAAAGWCSLMGSSTHWVTVDLGNTCSISQVHLYPKNQAGYIGEFFPQNFNIKVSADNVNWITVVKRTNYPTPGNAVQKFPFTSVNARYIRIEGTNISTNEYMQLGEIEIYQ